MRKPLLLLALTASVCAVAQQRLLGGDISMLPSYEESKAVYRDSEGKAVKPRKAVCRPRAGPRRPQG